MNQAYLGAFHHLLVRFDKPILSVVTLSWTFDSGNSIVIDFVPNIIVNVRPRFDVAFLIAFCLSSFFLMPYVLVSDYKTFSFVVSYKKENVFTLGVVSHFTTENQSFKYVCLFF